MTGDDTESGLAGEQSLEARRLQAKLDAGTITEDEYARLTALRFGKDPEAFSFADAAKFYDLTQDELREEMAWLSGGGRS
ncbi:MAG: hypothetical protein V5A45_08280 [Haloarculaceae archaeon]